MQNTTRKLVLGLSVNIAGWLLGAGVFFILSVVEKFAKKAQPIPYVFGGAALLLMLVYFIYWLLTKRRVASSKEKTLCAVMCVIACLIAVAAFVLVGFLFSAALKNTVAVAAICEGILLVITQVVVFIVARNKW